VRFAWDEQKAASNLKKHGDVREAATVFDDPLSTTFPDEEHSDRERRFVTLGMSVSGRLLVVAHTDIGSAISSMLGARL
jgi:uncharacterized DUF497 family protein